MDNMVSRAPQPGLWKRQFMGEATAGQNTFDLVFGAFLPVICFLVDPIVFRPLPGDARGPLAEVQLFTYSGAAIAISTLLTWLVVGKQLSARLRLATAGVLTAASAAALILGLLLLPFSILGLVMIIGVLGFTPLILSFVCGRNANRASRSTADIAVDSRQWWPAAMGVLIAVGVPALLQAHLSMTVAQSLAGMKHVNPAEREAAANSVRGHPLCFNYCADALLEAYDATNEETERAALSSAFEGLTGEDLETRSSVLEMERRIGTD